ncbi:peptidase inhibitor family I36 protein [Actinoplanes sp. NPDC049596]|uniref:peptidase inhibitor family I36 protein n=1 Tax=unclassified Actinoplanes TaxID=2626549 RepID=UPI003446D8B3
MEKRRVVSGMMGAVLATAGVVAVSPAAAQAAWVCQSGYVCIYKDYDKKGTVAVLPELSPASGKYTGRAQDFRNYKYTNGDNLNDSASSVVNLTDRTLRVYEHGNYNSTKSGGWTDIYPNSWSNINYGTGFLDNDKASSADF